MSKQTAAKQPRPITAWLKKEELEEREKGAGESQAKIIKQSLRVCIEAFDTNSLELTKIQNQPAKPLPLREQNPQVKDTKEIVNQKLQTKEKETVNQNTGLRRSTRNLQPGEKPVKAPVENKQDIADLPPILFKGNINYVYDFFDCAIICDRLLTKIENNPEAIVPIGFDLEWPFSFQTGSGKTALAQICLSDTQCHLLHLYNIKKLPVSFIALLSHPKVRLVGVNIKNDIWKLTRDFKEFPGQKVVDNNCLDCGPYANKVLNRSCRWSLERLAAYLLKKKIDKDPSVRRSKWHIHPLTDKQKLYAATDAYVSLLLYITIEQKEVLLQIKEKTAENTPAVAAQN